MDKNRRNIPVSFTVNNQFEDSDSRYLAITIDVLHTGMNFNGSIFSKEVVDANAESIKNTPVLGYIDVNQYGDLDYTKHQYKTIETEDGKTFVYAGSAYGVVPESCNYRWVEKECSDGETREYFQVDALLWTKFEDAVSVFEEEGEKPQSMELELESIEGTEDENGIFTFTGFKFDGCCLLSSTDETIQPAMIDSAAVAAYSSQNVAAQIKEHLDRYSELTKETGEKGGGLVEGEKNKDFTLNTLDQIGEIRSVLRSVEYFDRWGDRCSRFYLVDVQDDEVIVEDMKDNCRTYGMKFTVEGDKISIDFDSAKRKKRKFEDFENGIPETDFADSTIQNATEALFTKIDKITEAKEAVEGEFAALKAEYDEIKPKYDEYAAREITAQKEQLEAEKTATFELYDEHLADNEDYARFKANRDDYSLKEICSECAIMFAEKNLNANFSKKKKEGALTSEVSDPSSDFEINSRYGVLPTKD